MKTITVLITALLISVTAISQNLLNIYKQGTVKLVPDPEFAAGNEWDNIFRDYYDIVGNKPIGDRKSICVLPDGSFVVNHAYNKNYTKFSADGKFEKEFSIRNSLGHVLKRSSIKGVLANEILITDIDNSGRMYCTDLDGNLLKTLKVKYSDRNVIPLPNRKIAIVGSVFWKDRVRELVAIKDYETGEEKIIWDGFSSMTMVSVMRIPDSEEKSSKMDVSTTPPPPPPPKGGYRSQPSVIVTANNELLVCIASTGELIFYDLDGNILRTKKVNWKNDQVPVEELLKKHDAARKRIAERKFSEKTIERYGGKEAAENYRQKLLKQHDELRKRITQPKELPYYSTIMEDSDNNLLFFEYAKEKGANQFNVYALNGEGEFVCKSSFVCDDYDLVINPNRLVFKEGYLYGVQELKDKFGIPMRLVKFRLEADL